MKAFPNAAALAVVLFVGAGTPACADTSRAPSSASAQGPPSADAARPLRFLALGDSFTIGTGSPPAQSFPARLAGRWSDRGCALTLENVAVNGYTSEDVIELELPVIASFHPTLITVAVGANDIVRGRTLDAYRESVRRILDAAKSSGARVVVLPQPDWSRSPTAASFGAQPVLADAIAKFNEALAAEARAKGADWVDLYPLMQQQATKGQVAGDGLHPSADAYDAWAAELARVLPSPCPS